MEDMEEIQFCEGIDMPDVNASSIVSEYEAGMSMRDISKAHKISRQTVRRILIDAGAYANTTTLYAKTRLDAGASLEMIAEELGITRKTLISNLPHSRGLYGQATATQNAINIRNMRIRRKEKMSK